VIEIFDTVLVVVRSRYRNEFVAPVESFSVIVKFVAETTPFSPPIVI
jgi:hypothetical protein